MASTSTYYHSGTTPHPYAAYDPPAPSHPHLALPSTPGHPPPLGPLPPAPLAGPPSSSLPPPSRQEPYSFPGPSASTPTRQRGESSPVQSRHRELFEATVPEGSARRKSSSTTPRKTVNGREETREERRDRKERERATRTDGGGGDGEYSPSSHRHRTRSSRSRADLPQSPSASSPLDIAFMSPPLDAPPSPTTTITPSHPPHTSKSVLTHALQRAQSAVLLDSANNVPAAIAAYTSSVRLLKDVMVRVEEGSRRERSREPEPRDGETPDQIERRVARMERRERMRVDEARRLKVIHDTYEDRIQMLLSMGPGATTAPPAPPAPPVASKSTSPTSPPPLPLFQTTSTPPFTPRSSQQRTSGSSASLTPTATSSAPFSTPLPYVNTPTSPTSPPPTGERRPSLGLGGAGEPNDWSEGIGSAMLLGSPPPSPMDPMMPTPFVPTHQFSESSGRNGYGDGGHLGVVVEAPTMRRRPSIADEVIEEAPEGLELTEDGTELEEVQYVVEGGDELDDHASDATATTPSLFTHHSRTPPLPPFPPPALPPSSSHHSRSSSDARSRELSRSSTSSDLEGDLYDDLVPVTAIDFGSPSTRDASWPLDDSSELYPPSPAGAPPPSWLGLATSTTYPIRPPSFGASAMAEGTRRGSVVEDTARSRDVRAASISKLDPLPPLPSGTASRWPAFGTSKFLVRETTELGTISQRRKSPVVGFNANPAVNGHWGQPLGSQESGSEDYEHEGDAERFYGDPTLRPASIVVRPASADSAVFEFGQAYPIHPPHSAAAASSSSSYASASLPSRLRTASQPGKRPALGSFDSAPQPALPSTFGSGLSARSASGPNFARKGSIPTPTSLYAPPFPSLDRTNSHNSHSSQGSISDNGFGSTSGARSPHPSSLAYPERSETPISATFSRFSVPASSTAPSTVSSSATSTGIFLAPPPPPDPAPFYPIPQFRRPFHLMRQIVQSIDSGAYVTPRLYVPKQMWAQTGVKLVAVETKVRMLDLLLTGLEGVEKAGEGLVRAQGASEGVRAKEGAAAFAKELEDLEGLMGGIQSTLAKKLGYGTSGKKTGGTSFSAWSSKLSRSLDRVTNGRSLDSPATYVDGITRVFKLAQCLDLHLIALTVSDGGYTNLSLNESQRIDKGLRRASDFFGQVICQFILRDLGILLDKYVKRGGAWVGAE